MARQTANHARNGIEIKHGAALQIYALQWLLVGMLLFGPLLAHAQQAIVLDTASVNIQYKTQGHVQKAVALPYYWDFKEPGKSGTAIFDLGTVDNRDGQIDSIYIPRIGNHHVITLNGHDLESDLIEDPASGTHVSGPRLLRIPPSLQADSLNVRITLSAEQMTNAGLSRVTLGQAKELRHTYLL